MRDELQHSSTNESGPHCIETGRVGVVGDGVVGVLCRLLAGHQAEAKQKSEQSEHCSARELDYQLLSKC